MNRELGMRSESVLDRMGKAGVIPVVVIKDPGQGRGIGQSTLRRRIRPH